VTGGRGRKCKQLLKGTMETRGYWKSKEEAPDRTLWRTRFGRGCEPVVKTYCGVNEWRNKWAATGSPSMPLVCPNNLPCVGWHTLDIHSFNANHMTVEIIAPTALRHSGSMNGIHFITLSLTATSAFEQDIQQPHGHGVLIRNKSPTEMGGEEKKQRQEVRDQISYSLSKRLH